MKQETQKTIQELPLAKTSLQQKLWEKIFDRTYYYNLKGGNL